MWKLLYLKQEFNECFYGHFKNPLEFAINWACVFWRKKRGNLFLKNLNENES